MQFNKWFSCDVIKFPKSHEGFYSHQAKGDLNFYLFTVFQLNTERASVWKPAQ